MSDTPIHDLLYVEWLERAYQWVDCIDIEDDEAFDRWMDGL